ncbi:MAG: phytanoyl-CoA dioxygenase family protein [Pleurocapsa sp.]
MFAISRKLIQGNPLSFYLQQKAYKRDFNPNIDHDRYQNILAKLRERGFYILENHIPIAVVQQIKADVEKSLFALSDGNQVPWDIQSTSYPEFGTYVLHNVERFSSACLNFVQDDLVDEVVKVYSGNQAVSFGATAELRSQPRKNNLVDDWHTDTWKFRFKAILYLTDVKPENAPLRYLSGSHSDKYWRWRKFCSDYLRHTFPNASWASYLSFKQFKQELVNPAFKAVRCTGSAGTVILFDTRGIHCGSPLQKSHRLILNHTFVSKNDL